MSTSLRFVLSAAQRAPASLTLHYVPGKSFRFTIFALVALRQVSALSSSPLQYLFLQLPHWAPTSVTPTGQIVPIYHLHARRASSSLSSQVSVLPRFSICSFSCPKGHPLQSPLRGKSFRFTIFALVALRQVSSLSSQLSALKSLFLPKMLAGDEVVLHVVFDGILQCEAFVGIAGAT